VDPLRSPRVGRGGWFLATALLLALASTGCGYGLSTRWQGKGGADRVEVRDLENLSTEPGLGAAMTGALRTALARRGAAGAGGARIEGEVRAQPPVPSSADGLTWRISVELRARLVAGAEVAAEGTFSRAVDYLGGADPVESEGRRALALRRLADELAGEVLVAFER
jgi:hypothetical protein